MSEVVQQPEKVEEKKEQTLAELIQSKGGPSQTEIDDMKTEHGDVFVSAFSPEEIFVWRPLKRNEFRELQIRLTDPAAGMDQLRYEEAICMTCILWPDLKPGFFETAKGGTATSLAEQIMQNSNFLNPQQAAALVMKL